MASRTRAVGGLLALAVLGGCGDDRHLLGGAALEQNLGGSSGLGGAGGADPIELRCGSCEQGARCELIDDMEDGDPAIEFVSERAGTWYAFNDKTAGAEQIPAPDADYFEMAALDPPLRTSRRAAATRGQGFQDWGAGIGFDLRNKIPYDASRYAGVTFAGRAAGPRSIRFDVGDLNTFPQGGRCVEDCYDNFGRSIELDAAWRRFSFEWSDLKQSGWGEPQAARIDTSALFAMRFQVPGDAQGSAFELWIDDVAFLCK